MKVAVMQPYILPYLGYWQMITAVDKFVLFDDVNYIVRGWINRNNILMNGNAHLFTLPLNGASPNKLIKELTLQNNVKERNKLLRSIECSYRKAPMFQTVFPIISHIINNEEEDLVKFLLFQFREIYEYLGIKDNMILSSEIPQNPELKAQDKIMGICKYLGADHYINAIGGQELYDRDYFAAENMQLSFIKMNKISYKQFGNEFVPHLSIIDVLMFNTVEETRKLLTDFELI